MTVTQSDPKVPVAVFPEGAPSPKMPYSPAVKAGDWVFFAGKLATDFKNRDRPGGAGRKSVSRRQARIGVARCDGQFDCDGRCRRLRHWQGHHPDVAMVRIRS